MDGQKQMTIGVLDNDALSLRALRQLLSGIKWCKLLWGTTHVSIACESCLDFPTRPDVFLVDMALDGTNGINVCRQLNCWMPDMICMIGITAYDPQAYEQDRKESGMRAIEKKRR